MADFYSGYNEARARQEKSTMADLQALSGAQALMGSMQEQQAKAGALKRQQAAMSALSSLGTDATSEQRLAAIMPHLNPEQAAPLLQSDVTHRGNRENTRQIALARIAQQNDKLDQEYAIAMTKITDANQKRGFEEWYKRSKIALEAEARAQGADRSFYETGFRRPALTLPSEAGVVAPNGEQTTYSFRTPNGMVQGSAPSTNAALSTIGLQEVPPTSIPPAGASVPVVPTAGPQAQTPDAGRSPDAAPPAPAVPAPSVQPADAANLDARDLRARGQAAFEAARNPAAAAPVAPPKAPTLADAPADLSPRDKAKWLLQQTKPSIAGGGLLTPEALSFTAKQYLTGDRQAAQGYARNATARIALQNAIVEEAGKQGLTPEATAAKMAEFAGTMAGSRTVGQRAANINLAATEAEEMLSVVKDTSDKFKRTTFIPFNMAIKAYETNTGAPEVKEFGAALNALVNVYARAINPTGQPTISDKEHARALISEVNSPEQVEGVMRIIGRELEIAKRAPRTVAKGIQESVAPASGAQDRREKPRESSKRVVVDY